MVGKATRAATAEILETLRSMDKKLDKLDSIEGRLDTMSAQLEDVNTKLEDVNTKLGMVVLQADTLNNMEGLLKQMLEILRETPAGS